MFWLIAISDSEYDNSKALKRKWAVLFCVYVTNSFYITKKIKAKLLFLKLKLKNFENRFMYCILHYCWQMCVIEWNVIHMVTQNDRSLKAITEHFQATKMPIDWRAFSFKFISIIYGFLFFTNGNTRWQCLLSCLWIYRDRNALNWVDHPKTSLNVTIEWMKFFDRMQSFTQPAHKISRKKNSKHSSFFFVRFSFLHSEYYHVQMLINTWNGKMLMLNATKHLSKRYSVQFEKWL